MERCMVGAVVWVGGLWRWFMAVAWCDCWTSRSGDGCMEGCVAVRMVVWMVMWMLCELLCFGSDRFYIQEVFRGTWRAFYIYCGCIKFNPRRKHV